MILVKLRTGSGLPAGTIDTAAPAGYSEIARRLIRIAVPVTIGSSVLSITNFIDMGSVQFFTKLIIADIVFDILNFVTLDCRQASRNQGHLSRGANDRFGINGVASQPCRLPFRPAKLLKNAANCSGLMPFFAD